jgi:hypothetical protein
VYTINHFFFSANDLAGKMHGWRQSSDTAGFLKEIS